MRANLGPNHKSIIINYRLQICVAEWQKGLYVGKTKIEFDIASYYGHSAGHLKKLGL